MDFVDCRRHLDALMEAALAAVEPGAAVRRWLKREGRRLDVGGREYEIGRGRVFLVGAGKAAGAMGAAAAEILGEYLTAGVLISKRGQTPQGSENLRGFERPDLPASVAFYQAGHPVPDEAGVKATEEIIQLVSQATPDDWVLCLISGGASALLTRPVIPLVDWQQVVDGLLASGCTIQELNGIRRQLDEVKGGGLARAIAPAGCASLILSDVVGNPLAIIGSGPTVVHAGGGTQEGAGIRGTGDEAGAAAALAVLERYGMREKLPGATWGRIKHYLEQRMAKAAPAGEPVHHVIIGDVRQAAEAAAMAATGFGFTTQVLTAQLEGEAREVGRVAAALAKDAPPNSCLILGGETTVTLRGQGKGGRNQELALAAAIALDGTPGVALASFATDGDDGPTGAAGAVVTGETAGLARAGRFDPHNYLAQNDSYTFFDRVGGLLRTGPTGTNVNDLVVILKYGA